MTLGSTVYLIDDDDAVRNSIAFLLEIEGVEVASYASAGEFLAARSGAEVGVLVSDVRMPGIDGITLTRRLKDLGASLRVILITGHADDDLKAEATAAGAVAILEKPFSLLALVAEISLHLQAA